MSSEDLSSSASEETVLDALGPALRWTAGVAGVGAFVAGGFATFETDNELGTVALTLTSVVLLVMGVGGAVPSGFRWAGSGIDFRQRVRQKVRDAGLEDAPVEVQQAYAARVATGQRNERPQTVASVLDRFVKYQRSSAPSDVHDALTRSGWRPLVPATSTYIRWVYDGPKGPVSLYQDSEKLVMASRNLRDVAMRQEGARPRPTGREVDFRYIDDIEGALTAAEGIRREAAEDLT